ncbi:ABC transporter permease subunit [Streptomyces sp. NPDC052236]|uniref:ABC transporter permease subunit n=1 Tax=Streptomyces sp. NPDC052236 TaxID=3365686 RepID=UPI0037D85A65
MTTMTPSPYRSTLPPTRDGFPQLLHAEWTKLRTIGRWTLTLLAAAVLTVLISVISATGASFQRAPVPSESGAAPPEPGTGPDGLIVQDAFRFVHQPLTGDGSITARVSGLTGEDGESPGWAKAGLIVKQSTKPSAPYAAVMITPGHGVRMQSNFTHDTAGSAASADTPRWLRLTRTGTSLTGYESADGATWQKIGTVRLAGLPDTAEAGMFVASPNAEEANASSGSVSFPTRSTAVFSDVTRTGGGGQGSWQNTDVGETPAGSGESRRTAGTSTSTFTVTGSGDITPHQPRLDLAVVGLSGSQLGLVLFAALGVLFITAEYRRGMICTTLSASPRRGRVLVAKAVVIGGATFGAGLIAAIVSFLLTQPILREKGHKLPYFPELSLTDGPVLRAVVGTAALLALVAVFALGVGALLRHTAAAITVVVVLVVLPLILVSGLPLSTAQWVQRLTPVAGFAIQQTTPRYDFTGQACLPGEGCYPQGPWWGLAVLGLYAAVALGLAVWRLRRRDA